MRAVNRVLDGPPDVRAGTERIERERIERAVVASVASVERPTRGAHARPVDDPVDPADGSVDGSGSAIDVSTGSTGGTAGDTPGDTGAGPAPAPTTGTAASRGPGLPAREPHGEPVRHGRRPGSVADVRRIPAVAVMSTPVVTVSTDASLAAAWDLMYGAGLHHLVVMERDRVVGIVDDRTLAAAWPAGPAAPYHHHVSEVLRPGVHCVLPDTAASVIARVMVGGRCDAVPVISDDGWLCGLVTAADLVALLATS